MDPVPSSPRGRVLVVGAYFTDRESRIRAVRDELGRSEQWVVEQRWIALAGPAPADLAECTVEVARELVPKFTAMNRQLAAVDLAQYAHVLVCDDDITLPAHFVDDYLGLVAKHDLALAQPARTHGSYTDHHFVAQLHGIEARQTTFVEIGPLFSMRADAVALLTPFDEASPMGWGYDFVWPVVIERAGLKMGIVDAVPVAHDLRKPTASYDAEAMRKTMSEFLAKRPHLEPDEAFRIVASFA